MLKKGSYAFGIGMVGVGTIMLLGILNLGFLIPLFIAGFFIYTGWNIIKKAKGEQDVQTAVYTMQDMMPHHPYSTSHSHSVDDLDLWEKEMKQGGTK
jgi:hypothetical protein